MPSNSPEETAVVGGGIAGLSAAWTLEQAGRPYVLLEAAPRLGGLVHTARDHGFLMEAGPDSFLASKPAAVELCRQLDLEDALIGTLPAPGGPQILFRGRLHPLPAGWRLLAPTRLAPVLRSPLFSPLEKAALAWHWRHPVPPGESESVLAYLRGRFGVRAGSALAARITAPLLAGVYGGEVAELSAAAAAPPRAAHPRPASTLFLSLREGMGALAERLIARLPPERLRANCRVLALQQTAAGYALVLGDGQTQAVGSVILATPARQAAELLHRFDAALAAPLAAIPYASSVNINLAYRSAPPLPAGHGFLVSPVEASGLRACTFAHQKFPGRAPAAAALLRLFYGSQLLERSDDELAARAHADLRSALGISAPADCVSIQRTPAAMPQYTVGHAARLREITAALARHPRLALAGSAYTGVGIPDCIASAQAACAALAPQAPSTPR